MAIQLFHALHECRKRGVPIFLDKNDPKKSWNISDEPLPIVCDDAIEESGFYFVRRIDAMAKNTIRIIYADAENNDWLTAYGLLKEPDELNMGTVVQIGVFSKVKPLDMDIWCYEK